MKKYILIAGVNGAGKSTLYQTLQSLQDIPRVNSDEILKEFGDWRNTKDTVKAGKIAVQKIREYFQKDISFNQETTLCGNTIRRNIKTAGEKGYFIELHYVGVDSVEIAKQRVASRVLHGGHGIPEADIEKRYAETFKNLKLIIPDIHLAAFYDNTKEFRRFAIYKNGVLVKLSRNVPFWYQEYVEKSDFNETDSLS